MGETSEVDPESVVVNEAVTLSEVDAGDELAGGKQIVIPRRSIDNRPPQDCVAVVEDGEESDELLVAETSVAETESVKVVDVVPTVELDDGESLVSVALDGLDKLLESVDDKELLGVLVTDVTALSELEVLTIVLVVELGTQKRPRPITSNNSNPTAHDVVEITVTEFVGVDDGA